MGCRARLVVGLLAFEAVTAVTPTAPGLHAAPANSSVLVINGAPGRPAGMWRVTPDGDAESLLGSEWRPIAPSRHGVVAAVPANAVDRESFAYSIVRPTGSVRLPHRSNSTPCAAWSPDGRVLAYLSGNRETYGTRGTLWITDRRSSAPPVAVSSGLFPECPAWSTAGERLAYVIQSATGPRDWELRVYDGRQTEVVGRIGGRVTSLMGAGKASTFDWAPDGETLAWIQNHAVHVLSGGETSRLTEPGSLRPIADLNENPALRVYRSLRFSPNGGLIGVGLGYGAGIFAVDGTFVRTARGIFRGWAGDVGILTARPYRGAPSLLLYRAVAESRPELVQKYSKQTVATSPDGDWFAYRAPRVRVLVFRRPDGSLLSRVALDLTFGAWRGVAKDGRLSVPPWP